MKKLILLSALLTVSVAASSQEYYVKVVIHDYKTTSKYDSAILENGIVKIIDANERERVNGSLVFGFRTKELADSVAIYINKYKQIDRVKSIIDSAYVIEY